MFNVVLFLVFFLAIAAVFDFYCGLKKNEKNDLLELTPKSILAISLIVIVPVLLVTFRSENTGVDTATYLASFNDRTHGGRFILARMNQSYEILYYGFAYLFWNANNVRGAFFLFSFISLFFSFASIYRISKKYNAFVVSLLFLLIFFQECFNAMRQMNAVALVFFAYTFVLSRNLIMFVVCVVAASLFHSTALCALPLYFIYPSNVLNSLDYAKRIFVVVVLIIFATPIFDKLLSMDLLLRYSKSYGDSLNQVTAIEAVKYFLFSCFPIIFLSFLFSIGHSPQNKKDFDFLWCVVIIFSAIILLRTLQTWFWRLGWYYQLAEFILIGEICSKPILNNRTSGFYYQIAPSDVLILYAILWYLYWNYAHLETSALSNFALM